MLIGIKNIFDEYEYVRPEEVYHIRQGRKSTIMYLKSGGTIYTNDTPGNVAEFIRTMEGEKA